MAAVVDVYVKLIIAVLSFIAPTVTLLLPLLTKRTPLLRNKLLEQEKQQEQSRDDATKAYEDLIAASNPALQSILASNRNKYLSSTTKEFDNEIRKTKLQLQCLNLRSQVKRIFGLLLFSLFFVMLNYLTLSIAQAFDLQTTTLYFLYALTLIFSVCCFAIALSMLWDTFSVILEEREEQIVKSISVPDNP